MESPNSPREAASLGVAACPGIAVESYNKLGPSAATVDFVLPKRRSSVSALQSPPLYWIKSQVSRQSSEYGRMASELALDIYDQSLTGDTLLVRRVEFVFLVKGKDAARADKTDTRLSAKQIECLFVQAKKHSYDFQALGAQWSAVSPESRNELAGVMQTHLQAALRAWAAIGSSDTIAPRKRVEARYERACFSLQLLKDSKLRCCLSEAEQLSLFEKTLQVLRGLSRVDSHQSCVYEASAAYKLADLYRQGLLSLQANARTAAFYLLIAYGLGHTRAIKDLRLDSFSLLAFNHLYEDAKAFSGLEEPWCFAVKLANEFMVHCPMREHVNVVNELKLKLADMYLCGRQNDLSADGEKAHAYIKEVINSGNLIAVREAYALKARYHLEFGKNDLLAAECYAFYCETKSNPREEYENFLKKHHLDSSLPAYSFYLACVSDKRRVRQDFQIDAPSYEDLDRVLDQRSSSPFMIDPWKALLVLLQSKNAFSAADKLVAWNYTNRYLADQWLEQSQEYKENCARIIRESLFSSEDALSAAMMLEGVFYLDRLVTLHLLPQGVIEKDAQEYDLLHEAMDSLKRVVNHENTATDIKFKAAFLLGQLFAQNRTQQDQATQEAVYYYKLSAGGGERLGFLEAAKLYHSRAFPAEAKPWSNALDLLGKVVGADFVDSFQKYTALGLIADIYAKGCLRESIAKNTAEAVKIWERILKEATSDLQSQAAFQLALYHKSENTFSVAAEYAFVAKRTWDLIEEGDREVTLPIRVKNLYNVMVQELSVSQGPAEHVKARVLFFKQASMHMGQVLTFIKGEVDAVGSDVLSVDWRALLDCVTLYGNMAFTPEERFLALKTVCERSPEALQEFNDRENKEMRQKLADCLLAGMDKALAWEPVALSAAHIFYEAIEVNLFSKKLDALERLVYYFSDHAVENPWLRVKDYDSALRYIYDAETKLSEGEKSKAGRLMKLFKAWHAEALTKELTEELDNFKRSNPCPSLKASVGPESDKLNEGAQGLKRIGKKLKIALSLSGDEAADSPQLSQSIENLRTRYQDLKREYHGSVPDLGRIRRSSDVESGSVVYT